MAPAGALRRSRCASSCQRRAARAAAPTRRARPASGGYAYRRPHSSATSSSPLARSRWIAVAPASRAASIRRAASSTAPSSYATPTSSRAPVTPILPTHAGMRNPYPMVAHRYGSAPRLRRECRSVWPRPRRPPHAGPRRRAVLCGLPRRRPRKRLRPGDRARPQGPALTRRSHDPRERARALPELQRAQGPRRASPHVARAVRLAAAE